MGEAEGQGRSLKALFEDRNDRQEIPRRARLHRAGDPLSHVVLVTKGWLARLRSGASGADAFMGVYMAGDVIGLDAVHGARLPDDLVALTDASVLRVPAAEVQAAIAGGGAVATDIARVLAADATFLREALAAIGTQSSRERLGTFLLQTYRRLVAARLIEPDVDHFDLPLTQVQLGAVTGITSVHMNRVLRALKASGPFEFHAGAVRIRDPDGLRREAQLA